MDVQVNVWAVLAAMASSMVVGSIWYARSVFGNTWIKLARIDMSVNRGSVLKPIGLTVIVSLITAYVLAFFAFTVNQFLNDSFLHDALLTAFMAWLGLTAARFITHDAFEGRPIKLTVLNIANELVTIMVMGLIIGLIGV